MYFTCKPFDRLHVQPYGHHRTMRQGDLIAFFCHGKSGVVHRIIKIDAQGILTKGDNMRRADPWVLTKDQVVGRVVYAYRGKKKLPMYGGMIGLGWSFFVFATNRMRIALHSLLKVVYRWITAPRLVKKLFNHFVRIRIFRIDSSEYELHALFCNKIIGRYVSRRKQWRIIGPFRSLIDTGKLPAMLPGHLQGPSCQ